MARARVPRTLLGSAAALVALWAIAPVAAAQPSPGPSPSPSETAAQAPTYVASEPEEGEQVHKAPDEVTVTFSEPLDASSTMEVRNECGKRVDDGEITVELNQMSIGIAKKPVGEYQVDYVAVGPAGVTGSTEGSFTFTVHAGESCDGSGGGHDGHGGQKGGDQKGGGHNGGHKGSGRESGGHNGEHLGSGGGHTAGSGPAHTGHETAAPGSGHRADHDGPGHAGHHDKKNEHRNDEHASPDEAPDDRPIESAAGEGIAAEVPDATTALIALALAAALGVLGGWLLRQMGVRAY